MTFDPTHLTAIRYEVSDHVATVTISRPEVRNALNRAGFNELDAIFRHIQKDQDIRCVILTGEDPAFCTGEDIKEIMGGAERAASVARLQAVTPTVQPTAAAVLDCDRPIISAVNGLAVGWGMDLALFGDMIIASDRARFGSMFVKRGIVPDLGGMWRLPKLVGPQQAARLLYTGDIIDAPEASRLGLVMEMVDHGDLLSRARELASAIAANPPLAVRHMKAGLKRGYWGDFHDMGEWVCHTMGLLFQTEDHREGVRSFLEKRPPVFTGK
jgi:enoyl-CoA hydratase/carnithine racemase